MAEDPIVGGNGPVWMSLALAASVMCYWLLNLRQPKILWRRRESNIVHCLHGAGVVDGGTRGGL